MWAKKTALSCAGKTRSCERRIVVPRPASNCSRTAVIAVITPTYESSWTRQSIECRRAALRASQCYHQARGRLCIWRRGDKARAEQYAHNTKSLHTRASRKIAARQENNGTQQTPKRLQSLATRGARGSGVP